jgi:hypothetical protein
MLVEDSIILAVKDLLFTNAISGASREWVKHGPGVIRICRITQPSFWSKLPGIFEVEV